MRTYLSQACCPVLSHSCWLLLLVTTGCSSCSFKIKADTELSFPMHCPATVKCIPIPNQTEDKYLKRLNWFLLFTNEHLKWDSALAINALCPVSHEMRLTVK